MSNTRVVLLALAAGCHRAPEHPRAPAPPRPAPIARPAPRLTPDLVVTSIQTMYLPALRRCYVQTLHRRAGLRGRVRLAFSIDPAGRVVDPHVAGAPAMLAGCITDRMARWSFPGGRETVSFAVPLQLHSE